MGACTSKPQKPNPYTPRTQAIETLDTPTSRPPATPANDRKSTGAGKKSPFFPFYSPSPAQYLFSKKSPAHPPSSESKSANSTPRRIFKRPFPPPSPAKHIKAALLRRHGKNSASTIPEAGEGDAAATTDLDKTFGFSKQFTSKYEVGDEVGRGHFGYTCSAIAKKGDLKGQQVAVKVIPKVKVQFISQSRCASAGEFPIYLAANRRICNIILIKTGPFFSLLHTLDVYPTRIQSNFLFFSFKLFSGRGVSSITNHHAFDHFFGLFCVCVFYLFFVYLKRFCSSCRTGGKTF